MQPSPVSNCSTFSSPPKETPYSLKVTLYSSFSQPPPPQSWATTNIFSVCLDFYILDILYKWNHIICGLWTGLLSLSIMLSRNPFSLAFIFWAVLQGVPALSWTLCALYSCINFYDMCLNHSCQLWVFPAPSHWPLFWLCPARAQLYLPNSTEKNPPPRVLKNSMGMSQSATSYGFPRNTIDM